jgi:hypothetical protein
MATVKLVNLSVLKKLVCLRPNLDVGDRLLAAQLIRKSWDANLMMGFYCTGKLGSLRKTLGK